MRRTDSPDRTRSCFRSAERVFALNGQWFFGTREGEVGPFVSREKALAEVARFVREKHDLELFQTLRAEHAERAAVSTLKTGKSRLELVRVPLALVPKEETDQVIGNLAIERGR